MRSRTREVADLLDLRPADRVLEVGCGSGALAAVLADRVVDGHVVVVERSVPMADAVRKRAHPRITVLCDDVEDADLGDERFDVAVAVNVAPLHEARRLGVVAAAADRVVLVSEAPPQMDVEARHDDLELGAADLAAAVGMVLVEVRRSPGWLLLRLAHPGQDLT